MLKILTGSALRSFVDHLETCETVHLSVPLVQCWIIPILSPPGRKIKLPYEVHTVQYIVLYSISMYGYKVQLSKSIPQNSSFYSHTNYTALYCKSAPFTYFLEKVI